MKRQRFHPLAELLILLGMIAAIVFALTGCSILPDRVYGEAQNNNWRGPDDEDVSFAFGVEYDLSPQEVVIAGQQQQHPWDVRAALGLYEGEEDEGPVPLVVKDDANEETLRELHAAIVTMNRAIEANNLVMVELATDARAMRDAFDRAEDSWNAVNTTLLGGGGLGSLILILAGLRRARQAPGKPKED